MVLTTIMVTTVVGWKDALLGLVPFALLNYYNRALYIWCFVREWVLGIHYAAWTGRMGEQSRFIPSGLFESQRCGEPVGGGKRGRPPATGLRREPQLHYSKAEVGCKSGLMAPDPRRAGAPIVRCRSFLASPSYVSRPRVATASLGSWRGSPRWSAGVRCAPADVHSSYHQSIEIRQSTRLLLARR